MSGSCKSKVPLVHTQRSHSTEGVRCARDRLAGVDKVALFLDLEADARVEGEVWMGEQVAHLPHQSRVLHCSLVHSSGEAHGGVRSDEMVAISTWKGTQSCKQ